MAEICVKQNNLNVRDALHRLNWNGVRIYRNIQNNVSFFKSGKGFSHWILINVSLKWHLPRGYSIWCIVVLTSLIWKIRPVINESRPVSTEEYKSFVSKLKVVLIVIVMVAVVLEINHNNIYLNIMISGLLLTAITLIMGKVKYRQYKTWP